ncbi:unnamed protein product [Chironomus riparius]|uniref:Uncharacterized protein n=1 Tax=Chironomus riparius TaxID=315576 RepID=A0A9P0JBF4_9DIPT|nr:unnamed protein product [Chironomus riparius]
MNKIIFYLPKGIVKFFPNLEMLEVIQSELKEISSTDLEPFRILKYLDLSGNNIATLEGKLFQFNSKLEVLILNDNEISTVDQLTFYGLYNLKFLGFQRNRCFSDMTKDASAVQNMIDAIKFSCSEDNNRHSMNLENIKKEVTKSNSEMSILKKKLVAVVEENRNIRTTFDAHNKAVENLRTQLFETQKSIEDKLEKQVQSMDNKISPKSSKNSDPAGIRSTCEAVDTKVNSANAQCQTLSTDLHILGLNVSGELQQLRDIINNSLIDQEKNAEHASTLHSPFDDNLSLIFKNTSDFGEWLNNTGNILSVVDGIMKDISTIKDQQMNLTESISILFNLTQGFVLNINQTYGSSSIPDNILNQTPAKFLTYLLISNLTLIILFCAIAIYLCCKRQSQKDTKPMRIDAPTYRHLAESINQTPLPTPLNLNHDSIYGRYEYIDGNVQARSSFEDFYNEADQEARNSVGNDASESYAVVYRQERY